MWNRRFLFLWAGQTLANLGDVFYIVVFISVIYASTHSPVYTAVVPVVIVSAHTLSGLMAPLVFKHLSLTGMLWISQGIKTVLLLAAGSVAPVVAAGGAELLLLLYALGAGIAFMDGWANPARNSLVPRLVDPEQLMRANGLLATSDQVVHFAGWACGGLLVAWLGSGPVLWGTVGAYVISTFAMLMIRPVRAEHAEEQAKDTNWLTGWTAIREMPLLRAIVCLDVLIGMAGAVWMAAIMLPFVHDVLGKGEEWWGYINAAYMLGSIAGSALLLAYADRMKSQLHRWIVLGTIGYGVVTFLFGISSYPLVALLCSFALGPVFELQMISKQTLLLQSADEAVLPYVLSAKGTIDSLVFGISAIAMGACAQWLGTRGVYFVAAALLAIAVPFAWRLRLSHSAEVVKTE